ncbi:MAG TPA: hypothetical protein VFW93_07145 [Aquabacterium sp.]|uniref:hypothetical protein n=1 Tax=Aquabacterium sp. TaxID=1872578 RepID=UPI002E3497B1|nr:hypothetical protein [Aquabacterium sp.]HEX5355975.1 hypothetical protein [Aquabacterium sp.]
MPRCLKTVLATLALAAPALALAQSAVLSASTTSTSTSSDKGPPIANPDTLQGRAIAIPMQSLRGDIIFGQPPEVSLNGSVARLAPGARIRDLNNLLVLSGNLVGQRYKVNYTVDTYGLLMNVWLLTAAEASRLWPTNAQEAATWSYDPVSHTWTKP